MLEANFDFLCLFFFCKNFDKEKIIAAVCFVKILSMQAYPHHHTLLFASNVR